MEIYLLPIITFILCIVGMFALIREIDKNKELYLSNADGEKKRLLSTKSIIYCVILIIFTVAISVYIALTQNENSIWEDIKYLALLTILWPIAYTDFKTYRIPNLFIVIGLIYRIIILVIEVLFKYDLVWTQLLSEGIAAAALLIASGLCAVCVKNSIGFGDIKLFVVMGLMLGLERIWGAVFLSLIISFFIAAYLLITKKKNRKDAIPFGPSIVLGTYLSICLIGR